MKCWNCGAEDGDSAAAEALAEAWSLLQEYAEAWSLLQEYLVSIGEDASPPGPQDTPLGRLIEQLRPS